jgi:hypothetical protein
MRKSIPYARRVKPLMLGLMGFFLVNTLYAQSDTLKKPRVGNHVFTPITYSNLPLTNTYFSSFTGIGSTNGLVSELGDLPFRGLSGEVTFIELGFAYQQRVRDWLAAYVELNISARVGTELQSILTQGFSTITSFDIGWHIRLSEGEKYRLSGVIELQNNKGSFINLLGFVQDIINERPNPSLNEKVPLLGFASGLRYAHALNETIGFKASAALAYGETYTRGENGFSFDAGAGVDFDFYPKYAVPVGLVIIYDVTSMPGFVYVEGENSQMLQGKIAYTKASDFSLGIELAWARYPFLNQEKPVTLRTVALSARYYF